MRRTFRTHPSLGFTLVELMAVVVVLGVLAAIALTAFGRYVRRAKTAEARENLSRIYIGTLLYFERLRDLHMPVPDHPPVWTPSTVPHAARYPANVSQWTHDPRWSACGFSIDSPHYYRYAVQIDASGIRALAEGNLDGDGVVSSWELRGELISGDVQQQPLVVQHELE